MHDRLPDLEVLALDAQRVVLLRPLHVLALLVGVVLVEVFPVEQSAEALLQQVRLSEFLQLGSAGDLPALYVDVLLPLTEEEQRQSLLLRLALLLSQLQLLCAALPLLQVGVGEVLAVQLVLAGDQLVVDDVALPVGKELRQCRLGLLLLFAGQVYFNGLLLLRHKPQPEQHFPLKSLPPEIERELVLLLQLSHLAEVELLVGNLLFGGAQLILELLLVVLVQHDHLHLIPQLLVQLLLGLRVLLYRFDGFLLL